MTKSLATVHKEFFDQLGKKLKVQNLDDWYQLGVKTVSREGGKSILLFYSGGTVSREGLLKALSTVYPEKRWYPWKFKDRIPKGFWEEKMNQKVYLDYTYDRLGFKSLEDFYRLRLEDFVSHGGIGLLRIYNQSIYEILKKHYPDYDWKIWSFEHFQVPYGFWKQHENVKDFVAWAWKKLLLKNWTDWFRISNSQFIQIGGYSILSDYGSIPKVLAKVYPEYDWDVDMKKMPSKGHRFIFSLLHDIFKKVGKDMYLNYIHSELRFFGTGRAVELDVFIPSLKIAFEYHGSQHYYNSLRDSEISMNERKQLDDEKRRLCQANDITLIELPFWWNHQKESLIEAIMQQRPDLNSEIDRS